MSADNGVYIAKWNDGFRVVHAQAIENIDYFPEGSERWKQEQINYFGKSPVFKEKSEAILYAHELADKILADDWCPVLEYGVCYIGYRGEWPG